MLRKTLYLLILLLINTFLAYEFKFLNSFTTHAQQIEKNKCIVFVINKTNPVDNLSFNDLRKVLLGRQTTWPNGKKVTIVTRDRGEIERNFVLKKVYNMTDDDFDQHFLKASFKGEISSLPKTLSTTNGVKRFIFNVPGAIGFIKLSEIDETIKILKIDNLPPGENGYKFFLD